MEVFRDGFPLDEPKLLAEVFRDGFPLNESKLLAEVFREENLERGVNFLPLTAFVFLRLSCGSGSSLSLAI